MKKTIITFSVLALLFGMQAVGQVVNNEPNVYVAGYEKNAQNKLVATLWINGEVQFLSDGTNDSQANAVFVSGNDVYVVGYEYNYTLPMTSVKLWKNGKIQVLSEYSGDAYSVFVSGNDVYVVGYENRDLHIETAFIWKNGEKHILNDDGKYNIAYSIFVYESDVYVAGMEGNTVYAVDENGDTWLNHGESKEVAKLWKNGIGQDLTDGSTDACATYVYVLDGNVYVVGSEKNAQGIDIAKLWKNGVPQNLTNGDFSALAKCVYVQ